MAEAAILKVGLGVLQEIVRSGLLKEFEMISGVREDVEKLRSNLSAIEAVLADANERRVKDRIVDDWLKKVRDVAYQVDDVLDDFRFEALRRQAEIGDHALKKVFSLSVAEIGTLIGPGAKGSCEFFHDPLKGKG
ncbi:hypothetical protein QJS10_CPB17g01531 [Acorus calamus]|uniref:Disease resistance N-terminal domain-containing protein n=1 Tax=Acorus calamus TaxID=4465 RepID=A0AAV9CUE8_ACOCL|nr:hypothetical protein QJS10_CPB17g01531 [Acorus calamus]